MDPNAAEKEVAAARAVAQIEDGMLVGLGSGSTSACAVRLLGERVAAGLNIVATATSQATEQLAQAVGIPLRPFAEVSRVDLTIDGADEVTSSRMAIKGGGGALTREKIVAAASDRMIAIVDSRKLVPALGTSFRLPIEVLPFAGAFVERILAEHGIAVELRKRDDLSIWFTDQQNYIFDLQCGIIDDPPTLAARLQAIPGIVEHGLFVTEIDEVYVARGTDVEIIRP